jgi:hypothetical protein
MLFLYAILQEVSMSNTDKIRALNDAFRTTGEGGRIVMTRGVQAQGADTVREILKLIRSYNSFTPDNDPYSEHDFGSFAHLPRDAQRDRSKQAQRKRHLSLKINR